MYVTETENISISWNKYIAFYTIILNVNKYK